MIQKTIRLLDDRKHNIPKLLKFNNIKRLGHKIRELLIGGAIHKLYFLIKDELLKESQSNGIVLGISNMRKTCST